MALRIGLRGPCQERGGLSGGLRLAIRLVSAKGRPGCEPLAWDSTWAGKEEHECRFRQAFVNLFS